MTTPPPLPPEGGTTSSGPPWERRDQIGIVAALVETTTQVLSGPEAFFQRMPVTGGITGPLLYGLLIGYVGLVASTLYSLVFNVMFGGFGGLARQSGTLGGTLERLAPFMEGGASLVANLVLGPFFIAIGMFLATGIVHVMLLVLGGARRDFEATFRVIGYAQATSILQIVPVCGSFAHVVYWIVVAIIGLSHAQGITKGKAAAAVLVPLLLVCCCCALGVGVIVATVAGGLANVMGHQ